MQSIRKLDLNSLEVSTFEVAASEPSFAAVTGDPYVCCCTGCDSGCGIIPTGGGCESAATDTKDPVC